MPEEEKSLLAGSGKGSGWVEGCMELKRKLYMGRFQTCRMRSVEEAASLSFATPPPSFPFLTLCPHSLTLCLSLSVLIIVQHGSCPKPYPHTAACSPRSNKQKLCVLGRRNSFFGQTWSRCTPRPVRWEEMT